LALSATGGIAVGHVIAKHVKGALGEPVNKNGVRLGKSGGSIGTLYRERTANTYYSERFSAPRSERIESKNVSTHATCAYSHMETLPLYINLITTCNTTTRVMSHLSNNESSHVPIRSAALKSDRN